MSVERDTRAPARRHPETALVTGASSGIGLELARELAADGHRLAIVARDRARLTALADELRSQHGIQVHVYAADLSQAGAAENLWAALSEAGLTVDVLVNNAGVGLYGELQDLSLDALTAMQMINVVSLTTLTRLALPAMLARRHGRILNVASVVGYQPGGPRWAAYYGTKSYVLSFSKGLARELAGSGVSVTVLSPGLTRSAFEGKTGASETNLYRWVPQATAKAVAKAGYRAMMSGRRAVIPGLGTKLLAFAGELPPRAIALEVNHWLLSRRSAQKDGVTTA
jgi:short-subunit dehydrogenase